MLGTILTKVIEIVTDGILKSKGGKTAQDEMSVAIWKWMRPIFLKEEEELIEELEEEPQNEDLQTEMKNKIRRKAKNDESFAKALEEWLEKANIGSDLTINKMKAKEDIDVKSDQENSRASLKEFDSGGKINIDIKQK